MVPRYLAGTGEHPSFGVQGSGLSLTMKKMVGQGIERGWEETVQESGLCLS